MQLDFTRNEFGWKLLVKKLGGPSSCLHLQESADLGDIDIVAAHQPLQFVDQGFGQAGGGVGKIDLVANPLLMNEEGKPVAPGA